VIHKSGDNHQRTNYVIFYIDVCLDNMYSRYAVMLYIKVCIVFFSVHSYNIKEHC